MSTTRKSVRWLGFLPIACGLFAIIYLAATEASISEWIFPTGMAASLMVAVGLWFIIDRARA